MTVGNSCVITLIGLWLLMQKHGIFESYSWNVRAAFTIDSLR